MWVDGGETFTHLRHIDMVATFLPENSNPDVQGKVKEVWEVREVWKFGK